MSWHPISDVSATLNLSIDTIRRWEKKGLIKARRCDKGHRIFHTDEVRRVLEKTGNPTRLDRPFTVLTAPTASPYQVVELFSGAGGLALGMENAGLGCEMLVELDKFACATLRRNRPQWHTVEGDIHGVSFAGVQADVVAGGFPCQAFSYAGKRLGFEDTRGTLFYEFARAVQEIRPQVVVGENVRGLLQHDGGRTLDTMLRVLDELGYLVAYRVLRAQYFDVAQKRERLVIFGVRKDLGRPLAFPAEKNYTISVREALQAVPLSEGQKYTARKYQVMAQVPEGGYWRDLPKDIQQSYMGASFHLGGGKTGMARRLAWDEPALTLTCNPAQKQTERCHPSETRPLTVREYARIQSFPDDWQFVGSTAAQYKQIGNAVPVNLGYYIGLAARAMLSGDYGADVEQVSPHHMLA